jgi:hypothetical protein
MGFGGAGNRLADKTQNKFKEINTGGIQYEWKEKRSSKSKTYHRNNNNRIEFIHVWLHLPY